MIGILDCNLGNLRSVENAVASQGYDVRIVSEAAELGGLTHLILPGVGSYHVATARLQERELIEPLRALAASGLPVLGICLGMQLLSTTGDEGGNVSPGLDLIPGHVTRLDAAVVPAIPHVGWNDVTFTSDHPVLHRVKPGVDFYFVHSYHFVPSDESCRLGVANCGQDFSAIVGHGNVLGFQFHPEKSQANGIRLLDNFCQWDGRC